MNTKQSRRTSVSRPLWIIPAAALLAALIAAVAAAPASAQAPLEPRPASACSATLTVSPGVLIFGAPRPVTLSASGLEPGVSYGLFFNGALMTSGSADLDGRVQVSTTFESAVALLVNVQVVTESRCAAGTLIVAGPRRLVCDVLLLPGLPPFCTV